MRGLLPFAISGGSPPGLLPRPYTYFPRQPFSCPQPFSLCGAGGGIKMSSHTLRESLGV